MKEHAKKIWEGFAGLFRDLRKNSIQLSKQINTFLWRTGWIIVAEIIVVWILLASYLHRIERARSMEYVYDRQPRWTTSLRDDWWIRDMYRDIERMQQRMQRTRAYYDNLFTTIKLPDHSANYQKYFRSETGKGTYSLTYDQGKTEGFVQLVDKNKLSKMVEALHSQWLATETTTSTIFFSGQIQYIQPLLTLLQNQ